MLSRALRVRVLVPFVLTGFAVAASPQEERVESGTRVVLTGSVRLADGAPAAGAVVATSAGGTAVAGADGSFEIETAMPTDAQSLELTVVSEGRKGRADQMATLQVVPSALAGTTSLGMIALPAGGGAPRWVATFGGQPGVGLISIPTVEGPPFVHSMVEHDDGSGPALYVAGDFGSAGGVAANNVARWDGERWSAVGDLNTFYAVHALEVFDDGSGPVLCAGGDFGGVRKWNGSSWSSLGPSSGWHTPINDLLSFDDGSGPALYAAGRFTNAAGIVCNNIARWNGTSWSALGSGTSSEVSALAVFDDGSGPALYAGGWFTSAGGAPASRIAKWNGSTWSALGSGLNSLVFALSTFDDGTGPALYAGGFFSTAGGGAANGIARWNGTTWSALGAGMNDEVLCLASFDDGSGPALYAGGDFTLAGGASAKRVARWNGATWQAGPGADERVDALAVFDDGDGPALFAGGEMTVVGGVGANRIARWKGAAWSGLGVGASMDVRALTTFDDGGGEALYAGGAFTSVGGLAANHVARWDGESWSTLGSGVGGVFPAETPYVAALAVYDDGGGPALYAGGQFTSAGGVPANNIARWDGASWSPLGTGLNDVVGALCVYDDGSGPALYAGGAFTTAGGDAAQRIAKWNGSSWSALGAGIDGGWWVGALTVFDLGSGPELLVGGYFQQAGGVPVGSLAAWDGSGWADVAGGVGFGSVAALTSFDDGGGPALVAGGQFTHAGGLPAGTIAQFRGGSWSTFGSGLAGVTVPGVFALMAYDDGRGPALFVGGEFETAGSLAARHIARWDGSSWSAMGAGMNRHVGAFARFDDGVKRLLIVGGAFDVSPEGDSFLARWSGRKFLKQEHP